MSKRSTATPVSIVVVLGGRSSSTHFGGDLVVECPLYRGHQCPKMSDDMQHNQNGRAYALGRNAYGSPIERRLVAWGHVSRALTVTGLRWRSAIAHCPGNADPSNALLPNPNREDHAPIGTPIATTARCPGTSDDFPTVPGRLRTCLLNSESLRRIIRSSVPSERASVSRGTSAPHRIPRTPASKGPSVAETALAVSVTAT